ncbi:MAG: hypothetical protein QM817_04460 [Archangium sp.]
MGMFDYRCVATNLPTAGKVVSIAVMEVEPGRFAPVSLGVSGVYDRYGRVENFTEDFRIVVLANALEEAAKAGRVLARDQSLDALNEKRPVTPQSAVLMIERATTMSTWLQPGEAPALLIDGKRLQHMFVVEPMFKAIVGTAGEVPKKEPTAAEVKALVAAAFPDAFGAWVHRDLHKLSGPSLRKVAAAMNEIIALNEFMRAHALGFAHPATGQYFFSDSFVALLVAKKKFPAHAGLQKAFEKYAKAIEDEASEQAGYGDEEASKLPERWVRNAAASSWYGLRVGERRLATTSLARLRVLLHDEFANSPEEVIAIDAGVTLKRVKLEGKLSAVGPAWDWLEQELPVLATPFAKSAALVWGPPDEDFTELQVFTLSD